MTAAQASNVATANNRMSLGTGTSPTARQAFGVLDEDATATVELDVCINYNSVLAFPSTTGTLQASYDLDLISTNSFRVIVDTAGGVASEFQAFVAFDSEPVPAPILTKPRHYMKALA
jgi:hypothetical protein